MLAYYSNFLGGIDPTARQYQPFQQTRYGLMTFSFELKAFSWILRNAITASAGGCGIEHHSLGPFDKSRSSIFFA
jgi:hypothetical protein